MEKGRRGAWVVSSRHFFSHVKHWCYAVFSHVIRKTVTDLSPVHICNYSLDAISEIPKSRRFAENGDYSRKCVQGFSCECQVCDVIGEGAKVSWSDRQKVPFAVLGDQWISFDNNNSLTAKVGTILSSLPSLNSETSPNDTKLL